MNIRKRNKYCGYTNCSHRSYNKDVLCYNPYFEQIEDYCKLGRYGLYEDEECRCYNCRHFTLSKSKMKKVREIKRQIKEESKLYFHSWEDEPVEVFLNMED